MKKYLNLLICALVISIMLVSCGKKDDSKDNAENTLANQTLADTKLTISATNKVGAQQADGKSYFDGKIANIDDLTIEITDYKVIEPGQEGNEYGDDPVIAFWYKVTNKTDKEIDATMAWFAVFSVIQDNNPNTVNKLEVGMSPDDSLNKQSFDTIKKGGTVEAAIAYTLSDTETPVILKATKGPLGGDIGEATYELKK